jgi:hypothetical protein
MAKLFNKIRKQLVADKPSTTRTANYLKYAIGEIILVMIGILLALQVNNWNESRKQQQLVSIYINKIINDLETDIKNIDSLMIVGQRNVKIIENYFGYFENQENTNIQPLIDSCSIIIGKFVKKYRYTPNNHTFKDMQASGNSTLLKENQRAALVELSNTQDYFLIVFEKTLSSIIESERNAKTYVDLDLSPSNFFKKINVKQSKSNLVQGLLHQHNSLTSYSALLFHTKRLKNRILKESNQAISTFEIN